MNNIIIDREDLRSAHLLWDAWYVVPGQESSSSILKRLSTGFTPRCQWTSFSFCRWTHHRWCWRSWDGPTHLWSCAGQCGCSRLLQRRWWLPCHSYKTIEKKPSQIIINFIISTIFSTKRKEFLKTLFLDIDYLWSLTSKKISHQSSLPLYDWTPQGYTIYSCEYFTTGIILYTNPLFSCKMH